MDILSSDTLFSDYNLFCTASALLIPCIIILLTLKYKSKKPKFPPGPPGWPVVGNLFQVTRSGKQFFEYVKELNQKYGPIFTLKMGSRTLIILTDPKLIHEAFIERGALFATRPPENPTRSIFSCNKFTVNASVHGPVWRSLRRNMVQNMLSSSRIKEFSSVRVRAMDTLISKFQQEADANDGVVWVLKTTRFAMFCILLVMCFGIDMDEETNKKMDQVMKSVLITLNPRVDDYLPLLSLFFSKQKKRALEVRKKQIDFMLPIIEQRRKALQNPGSDKTAISFSYLDTLFDLKIEGRKSSPSGPELVSLCSEFLNGGTDTSATAIEWGMAELIANPECQSKLYDEIKQTVGDRKVAENDVDKMPYLQAVVKELLRKHPPTHFTLTHSVTEPTKLAGFDIQTNLNVELYLPGIAANPEVWTNPEMFDPDRFISGKEDADVTGVTGVKMLPFGVGRRICPGLGLGTMHIQLVIARMVQEFEWSAYPEHSKVDFTGKLEFTMVMQNSLRATIKKRV